MSSLLAIDSGYPDCACASAVDGSLKQLFSGSVDSVPGWVRYAYDRVVVEIPTLRGDATPNPEDLLLIAVRGARLAQYAADSDAVITEYRPSEWKGNTPKPPHHARMWEALSPAERTLLGGVRTHRAILAACKRGATDRWRKPGARYYRKSELPAGISHDILDAAALALFALGRIRKG